MRGKKKSQIRARVSKRRKTCNGTKSQLALTVSSSTQRTFTCSLRPRATQTLKKKCISQDKDFRCFAHIAGARPRFRRSSPREPKNSNLFSEARSRTYVETFRPSLPTLFDQCAFVTFLRYTSHGTAQDVNAHEHYPDMYMNRARTGKHFEPTGRYPKDSRSQYYDGERVEVDDGGRLQSHRGVGGNSHCDYPSAGGRRSERPQNLSLGIL